MGKTITSIVLVAAAVAVNVIPGVGQAISGALVSAGLGSAAAAGIATLVTTAVTTAGLTAGLQLVSGGQTAPKPPTTEGPLKTSIPPRIRAYGRGRLYGAYALFETAANGTAVDAYAIHDGPIDGIERRYLADDQVTVVGTTVQTGTDKRYQNGVVQWYETLGPRVNTAFAAIVALLPGIWTNNHRGDGVVTLAVTWKPVKADLFQETYPQSGPVPASIVARWQRVFDWRDPSQSVRDETTWKWSENAALHLAHYRLTVEKAYRAVDKGFPGPDALQAAWDTFFKPTLAYWSAAAAVCDEQVALKSGGSEPRYRSSFSHNLNAPHKDVITSLTACFDGWTSPRADGALVVYAGRYYPPTVTIGPEHIVSYNWQDGIDDENTVNEVKLTYISAEHDYGAVECDPWTDPDDIARRGVIRSQPLENPVPSWGQARRLAKRLMARIMAPYRGTVTTNVAGRIARGQRYIHLRIVEAGAVFFDGVAEITQLTRNLQTGGVTFAWVAADQNIDAWNPATEEGSPAAAGSRVPALPLDTPSVTSAEVAFTGATEEGTGGRINIYAAGPDRDDLTWYARWRVQGGAVWNEQRYSDVDPGPAVQLLTSFVPLDKQVEVAVAYEVGDGRLSDYSPAYLVNTSTDATPPDQAVAVTVTNWGDTLDVTTDNIPRARSYRWRFYAQASYVPALYAAGPGGTYDFGTGSATRTGPDGWTGNFYGERGSADCFFIFRIVGTNIFTGLTDTRTYSGSTTEFQAVPFYIYIYPDGRVGVFENGAESNYGTVINGIPRTDDTLFAMGYSGTSLRYYILAPDGTFSLFKESTTAAGRVFYPAGASYSAGGRVDQMQFRPVGTDIRLTQPPVLVRTITTIGRTVQYTKALAAADGVARAYVVSVAGVNAAGAGAEATSGLLTNPAPPRVTGVSGNTDPTTGAISFDLLSDVPDLAGYAIAYSTTAHFDPLTQGFVQNNLGQSPAYVYGLAAGTYYAKVAAYDTWSDNPLLLNYSLETTFTISAGGGGSGGGSGTGGGGGGYCVTEDTPVLMADGREKPAGEIRVGDEVWTQHEETMAWGKFPVIAAETVDSDDVWRGLGIHATGDHRVWLSGSWQRMRDLGVFVGSGRVVKLTVADAHTYYSAGLLSHNVKIAPRPDDE